MFPDWFFADFCKWWNSWYVVRPGYRKVVTLNVITGVVTCCCHRLLFTLSLLYPKIAQRDIRSIFRITGGGDDEKTDSLQLSHQAEKRK